MRHWIKVLYVLVAFFIFIQLFPLALTNPPVDPARTIHASMPTGTSISSTLARGCNDCHSNLTVWPWYSKVAPVSWLVVSDVRRGRKALNFSDWKSMSQEKQRQILPKICKEVADREMPPEQYAVIHRGAEPSHDEIEAICSWAQSNRLTGTERAQKE